MSERGLPIADGAPACPFVAFEDDRDERATVPDHRHRCYAEVRPAPRALAHQAAYCLSSAFPVCPTFQDWARRESARARDAAAAVATADGEEAAAAAASSQAADDDDDRLPESAPPGPVPPVPPAPPVNASLGGVDALDRSDDPRYDHHDHDDDHNGDDDEHSDRDSMDDLGPRRNPPRDWSAPPPWLASAEATRSQPAEPPDFLAGRSDPARGLAGSAADLLAGGSPPRPVPPSRPISPADLPADDLSEAEFEERDLPRPAVPPRRPRAYDQHLGGPTRGPDWERPRRYEAYPTIRTRMSLPAIPRLAGLAAAVAVAALALFFFGPPLLGIGGDDDRSPSPSPSASPTRSIAPTPTPAPTPVVYIIKPGDTLSKIAIAHGTTVDQILAANPSIKDPNKIIVGNQITIPAPSPAIPDEFGGSPGASSEPSP